METWRSGELGAVGNQAGHDVASEVVAECKPTALDEVKRPAVGQELMGGGSAAALPS